MKLCWQSKLGDFYTTKACCFTGFLKANFFPRCSIMEASHSSSGSYAWHSILKGRDVLLKGAKWKVGCGDSIGVCLDSWLPSYDHPRILSPLVAGFEDDKVVDLIDTVSKKWDVHLLQGLFNPHEVELIMSIPLCRSYVEDKLVWPFTPSGTCTVKPGYRFLVNENSVNSTPMNSNQNDGVWKLIWALSVPNKVKNFVWRSCRDALLIKYNLRRR